ncbi:hypothetical protein V6N11_033729 [Hibiscus sabdariffa]|uniref:Uncharacterized protein n=1 Tax=Hibiscus sabdariffa TaxID=183260 RepID=A0ABR2S164_9ROSI
MPVCSCAARLAGGGWDSGVFGAAVWQPHGGFRQFCWLHRDGLVQFRWQNRGGPVQSRRQHHGDPMQFRWQHRGGPVQFRWQHRLARMPPGITGAGMMVWCASSGTPMPLLATMFVTALVVGSTLSRPVTVAGAVIGCLAWRPSLFSWCTSKLTATVFLSIACPGVAPFPWPINLVACFAEGPMGRSLPLGYVFGSTWGLLVVAKGAPLVRPRFFGRARPWCSSWCLCLRLWMLLPWSIGGCWVCLGSAWGCWSVPRVPPWFARSTVLGLGISDPRVRFVPMAFDGCLCGGCSLVGYLALPSELFADWLLLHRVVLSARPRESLISCFTSSLLRVSFLVNEAIPEAADSIIREVAAKILGADAPSDGSDPPIALAKMGPSPSASPPKSGLSKSAPAGLRRAAMPVVPEHQEFDEWCAARSRTPPANVAVHPSEARASSIPPPRPHKRQAPSSDPSRAKRSRASASSSSRIPSPTKAGMSSVNNSPAETARQSRREK